MSNERMRVTVEFSKSREQEVKLFEELMKYSNPQAIIKDVLLGVIPLTTLLPKVK